MANVQEFSLIEMSAKEVLLDISCTQTSEPIVSHKDCGFDIAPAAEFKYCLIEDCKLIYNMSSTIAAIRTREYIRIMQEC
jgi:hypothetical protein